jgi:hypothetical protein
MNTSALQRLARVIYKMPKVRYLRYLKTPHWQRRRREHLAFCDYWCEHCKKDKAMQVHHWTYANLGYEPSQDLYAVCVTCHHKLHCMVMPIPANDNVQYELDLTAN